MGRFIVPFGLVVFAVTLAYANHFGNSFHLDDYHSIQENPAIRDLRNIPRFFVDATTFSVSPADRSYRPLVSASLALDYRLGGYDVFWYHLSTFVVFIAFLAALAALFASILESVRPDPRNRYVALFAVAWFGLHPIIAETINNIIQRSEVYSTFGVVGGLLVYARSPRARKTGLYLVPVLLGVLSKPPALIFPFLLVAYIWYFEEGAEGSKLAAAVVRALPAFAACALLAWLQAAMTPKSFTGGVAGPEYILIQPFAWLRYFIAFFFPVHVSVDSAFEEGLGGLNLATAAGFLFLGFLLAAIYLAGRRPSLRPVAFGLAWFAIALLPTSLFPLAEVANDHRLFFAYPGLALAAAWTAAIALQTYVARGGKPSMARGFALAGVIALGFYAYGTHVRNEVWHSDETLWRDAALKDPHNGRALMLYARAEMVRGDYSDALAELTQAERLTPNDWALQANLGIALGGTDRPLEAEPHFLSSLALAGASPQPHFYYARWLDQMGRTNEALTQLHIAEHLDPSYADARELAARIGAEPSDAAARARAEAGAAYWIDLSLRRYGDGQYAACIYAAHEAIAIDPKSAAAYNNVAAAESALGQWDAAIAAGRRAVALDPKSQLAKNNLAWALRHKQNAR